VLEATFISELSYFPPAKRFVCLSIVERNESKQITKLLLYDRSLQNASFNSSGVLIQNAITEAHPPVSTSDLVSNVQLSCSRQQVRLYVVEEIP
jgi:hypothetical protein